MVTVSEMATLTERYMRNVLIKREIFYPSKPRNKPLHDQYNDLQFLIMNVLVREEGKLHTSAYRYMFK